MDWLLLLLLQLVRPGEAKGPRLNRLPGEAGPPPLLLLLLPRPRPDSHEVSG